MNQIIPNHNKKIKLLSVYQNDPDGGIKHLIEPILGFKMLVDEYVIPITIVGAVPQIPMNDLLLHFVYTTSSYPAASFTQPYVMSPAIYGIDSLLQVIYKHFGQIHHSDSFDYFCKNTI